MIREFGKGSLKSFGGLRARTFQPARSSRRGSQEAVQVVFTGQEGQCRWNAVNEGNGTERQAGLDYSSRSPDRERGWDLF